MARISGVDLPNDKRVEIGLTYIYGIGRTTSNEIMLKSSAIISLTTSQLKVTFAETQLLTLRDL